jgi:hypothetical protein
MASGFDISAGPAVLEDGTSGISIKVSSSTVEVNVWFSRADASRLDNVLVLSSDSKAIRLGTSANAQVHWAKDDEGHFYLLIGRDDETWDIGLTLDDVTFRGILSEIAACGEA